MFFERCGWNGIIKRIFRENLLCHCRILNANKENVRKLLRENVKIVEKVINK